MSKKFFICSDIHSFYTELRDALDKVGFDINNPEHILCIVGDAYDRGDGSIPMFEFMKEMQAKNKLLYVRGNHESLIQDCVHEIYHGKIPGWHHFSNGTVKTICQFCGQNEWIIYDPSWRDKICETMQPVLDFINDNCVNYAEIGDYVLVHSTIPIVEGDWREASQEEWDEAMWGNPYIVAESGNVPDGKQLIFGHFHTSWPRMKYEGKPEWDNEDGEADFSIYYGNNYIALDGCAAYSRQVNILVIDEDGNIVGSGND